MPLETYQKDIGSRPTAFVSQDTHHGLRSRSHSPSKPASAANQRKASLRRQYSTTAVRHVPPRSSRDLSPSRRDLSANTDLNRQLSTLRTSSPAPLPDRGRKPAHDGHVDGKAATEDYSIHESIDYPAPIFTAATFHKVGIEDAQILRNQHKARLARCAYLRHSFNRMDFIAVVSFWIAFVLEFSGITSQHHIYVFRMLSCMRIFRLLGISEGTTVIVSSKGIIDH